jgi:DNA polymerase beta
MSSNTGSIINKKNEKLVKEFEKLVGQIKFDIDTSPSKTISMTHFYRLKQIKNVISIIREYPKEIKSGKDLENIKGIGKGSITRIDEILEKGSLSEIKIDAERKEYLKEVEELEQIFGIGRKKAYDLITKHKIKSIKDLKKAYNKGEIELTDQQIVGLKYYNIYKENIPRNEIDQIDKFLFKIIKLVDERLFHTICGSYRRNKMTSNDIDILISHPNIKTKMDIHKHENLLLKLVKKLKEINFLVADLTDRDIEVKYMGFAKFKDNPVRRIDIRYIPYDSWATGLLYFTGSGDFNKKMRELAIELGYKLNEFGLYKVSYKKDVEILKQIKTNSEKEIFDHLGMEYLTPDKRY